MKRALVFQHMDHDHPGRFLDFFAEDGIVPEPVRLFEGQDIPSLAPYDFLFVLGGAQDTWQEDQFPWLAAEKQAIREWVVERARPYFGVCLGHQLLSRALGGETYKLPFGHHGGNHPVRDLQTGKVEITSQNHNFCVDPDSLSGVADITHINLNDQTNEGMRLLGHRAFSVQYHPEAGPGPHDSRYLFAQFADLMENR